MQQQDIIQKIQHLIAEGETEDAITELVEFARNNNPELYENAILLSGQYKQWKREKMLGIEQTTASCTGQKWACSNCWALFFL